MKKERKKWMYRRKNWKKRQKERNGWMEEEMYDGWRDGKEDIMNGRKTGCMKGRRHG